MTKWIKYVLLTKQIPEFWPKKFNPAYPWWFIAYSFYGVGDNPMYDGVIIHAYLPEGEDITEYWPDAYIFNQTIHDKIEFTHMRPKPSYFKET